MDEQAWMLAGKVALMLHLSEATDGWLTYGGKQQDHEMLTGYGYSVEGCPCGLGLRLVEVPLGSVKVAQMRLHDTTATPYDA